MKLIISVVFQTDLNFISALFKHFCSTNLYKYVQVSMVIFIHKLRKSFFKLLFHPMFAKLREVSCR